jgi:release factor glutamine methyltransferase
MTLYVDHARPLVANELDAYRELIRERGRRVPLQHLTGSVHLLDLEFRVRRGVFIPRPETETLIRTLLELHPQGVTRAAEVGIGSGCISISLLRAWPNASIVAWDIAAAALDLARENAGQHGVAGRLNLLAGDGVQGLQEGPGEFELVFSNPPYVGESERKALQAELHHDPPEALFAGEDGMALIERLIPAAATALRPGGWLVFEHGANQAEACRDRLGRSGFAQCETFVDLAGRPRVSAGRR